MSVQVYVKLDDDSVHKVPDANYCDFDDAGGDFKGDLWGDIYENFEGKIIKEIIFRPSKPLLIINNNALDV